MSFDRSRRVRSRTSGVGQNANGRNWRKIVLMALVARSKYLDDRLLCAVSTQIVEIVQGGGLSASASLASAIQPFRCLSRAEMNRGRSTLSSQATRPSTASP